MDEVLITIRGERYYLWRAVDQDGDVLDILVTRHRDRRVAKRFFHKVLKQQGKAPWQLVTDKLRSHRLDQDLWCSGPRGRILAPYGGLGMVGVRSMVLESRSSLVLPPTR